MRDTDPWSALGRLTLGVLAAAALFAAAAQGQGYGQAPGAQAHALRVSNHSALAMVNFYATNVDEQGWRSDLLGETVLVSGQSIDLTIDDGSGQCLYDFRAVFANGRVETAHSVNICQVHAYDYREPAAGR